MGYVVKPADVDVPADDPFRNDRLERDRTAEALSRLVGTIEGPCVVSLDAEWGMGKTTFLQMWSRHLRDQGYPVVMFNAWDNDFANEPFLALSEELHEALSRYDGVESGMLEKFTTARKKVLVNAIPAISGLVVNSVTGGVGGSLVEGAVGRVMAPGEPDPSRYGRAKEAMSEFRSVLETAASTQGTVEEAKPPLVVLIDELDRCRPSYAVELLEVLKHLFAVKGVVFVLAVNRSQLEHSVKALYGAEFDAAVYLRRFFDVGLRLPDANRDGFIDAQLAAIWDQLGPITGINANGWREYELALVWLRRFFGQPDVDLRTVRQALHHLGLMLAMQGGVHNWTMLSATLALILRTRDPVLLHRLINEEQSERDVANAVFSWVDPGFRDTNEGYNLEAVIVVAALERQRALDSGFDGHVDTVRALANNIVSQMGRSSPDSPELRYRAGTVLEYAVNMIGRRHRGILPAPFGEAVRMLELVSSDGREGPH